MDNAPLKISRSNLQLLKECPRCFWLYKNKGIYRPRGYPYTLALAIDTLLKKEFDTYREKGELHPSLINHGVKNAKLFDDLEKLKLWRNNFQGLRYYDRNLNAYLFGAVDDILEFDDGSLAVIDYKSSGAKEVRVYDDYQMQMDVYTYILEQLGEKTSRNAYFVFYQVERDKGFDGRLPFRGLVKEVKTEPDYVADLFDEAVHVARNNTPPSSHSACEHCLWASHHKNLES